MSAQLQRRSLRHGLAVTPKATGLTVHLQTELRLDATAYKESVAALLFDRGLVVAAGEHADGVATVRSQHKAGASTARTPEDILANPTRLELVTTSVPSMADSVGCIHALRPHFPNTGPSLSVHDRGATIEITGTRARRPGYCPVEHGEVTRLRRVSAAGDRLTRKSHQQRRQVRASRACLPSCWRDFRADDAWA